MESSLFWNLEQFLLNPSNKSLQKEVNELKESFKGTFKTNYGGNPSGNASKFNEVFEFLIRAKRVDLYKGVLALDRLIGEPTFLLEDPESTKLPVSSDIHDYVLDRISKFLNREANPPSNLEVLVVLGALVLFVGVFVRINWLGPPYSLALESERVLSEKFEKKAVEDEMDDSDLLKDSFVDLLDKLDLKDTKSTFILDKVYKEFAQRCVLRSPELSLIDSALPPQTKRFVKSVVDEFVVDGESIYYGVSGIQYLYAAIVLMEALDTHLKARGKVLKSLEIWRARVAYLWQLIVEDSSMTPCPTLFNCTIVNYVSILKESQLLDPDFTLNQCDPDLLDVVKVQDLKTSTSSKACSTISNFKVHSLDLNEELKPFLLIELLQKLPLYNLNRLYSAVYDRVAHYLDFSFDFTGKLGVRRKYQKTSIPQLMVDYKKERVEASEAGGPSGTPVNLTLDEIYGESDIYETPKLDDSEAPLTLTDMDRLFLISKGFNILATTSQNDELGLQFINAIATTCLRDDSAEGKNWLITSTSLWLRCKTEYNRTKTIERATLQLHSLSDSFYERTPLNRLEYFFGIGFPSTWNIKREIGKHMFSIASFRTAYDIYKQLHLWEDAIKCLLISDRKQEAKELVNERLKLFPTPQLYCYLGDIENDPEHYKTAWKVSGEKSSRAVRSLGARAFNAGRFEEAIGHLEKSVALNPMHENTQFLLGCCYLKTSDFASALNPFSRVVSLNPENSDCWANLATCHINLNNMSSGKVAIMQAIKFNNTRWQFWDIFLRVSVTTQDVQSVCNTTKSLIDLGKKSEIGPWAVAFLVEASNRANEKVSRLIDDTLKLITRNLTEDSDVWSLYARYLSFRKDYVGALEATFKQYRKVEQDILLHLAEKKDSEQEQMEFDVSNVKKLTNALSSMVALLKRMSAAHRSEHRESVLEALRLAKGRVSSRTPQVNEQFSREVDLLVESAEVEDVIAVYEDDP